ncbi:hypothetical protein ACFVWY_05080 [Streptomyces sp. NPDC058195]|uniref:hypothetical protein n=1 Tax=Streptomyces sp. NPDC058195 TaxID=3346375 RepID=UPI0036E95125
MRSAKEQQSAAAWSAVLMGAASLSVLMAAAFAWFVGYATLVLYVERVLHLVSWGVAPLGAAAGGLAAAAWGLDTVWIAAAAAQAVGIALVWRNLSARAFDEARLPSLNEGDQAKRP